MSENIENNQDQLSLKQELLKNEIIAKNYDGQKFLEYCINLKENGDDMNNWTYEELKLVVENFKADYDLKKEKSKEQINKEITQENNNKKNDDDIETEKLDDMDMIKTENENTKKDSDTKDENNNISNKEISDNKSIKDKLESKINEFPFKLLEKSILNDKEIKVTIKNPKTNEKTLLSLAYVTYEVYTEPFLWLVRRRYNDFSLLRNILCKFYPRNLIPPLPEKKIRGKIFQP